MRSVLRTALLPLALLALLLPYTSSASNGPCPDDPSRDCVSQAPPFYVVINRSFEDLSRPGSGCQPIILNHPDCIDCCGEDRECILASDDLVTRVCPILASRVNWIGEGQTEIVYEMCCNCATDPDGVWMYRIRLLFPDGSCPIDPQNGGCFQGLPLGTGIDLPAPVIVGGLALISAVLLGVGVVMRRRIIPAA